MQPDQRHLLRNHGQQRFGHAAEQLVEPDQRVGGRRFAIAETALDRIAPQGRDLAQPLEPQPAQYGHHILVEPKRGHGQIGQGAFDRFVPLDDSPSRP